MKCHLDCWPSGRFWVGRIVPPAAQATIIFACLSIFDSTAERYHIYQSLVSFGVPKDKAKVIRLSHTLDELRVLFCACKNAEKCKRSAPGDIPSCPLLYKPIDLHIDSIRRMSLHDAPENVDLLLSSLHQNRLTQNEMQWLGDDQQTNLFKLFHRPYIKNHEVVFFLEP